MRKTKERKDRKNHLRKPGPCEVCGSYRNFMERGAVDEPIVIWCEDCGAGRKA